MALHFFQKKKKKGSAPNKQKISDKKFPTKNNFLTEQNLRGKGANLALFVTTTLEIKHNVCGSITSVFDRRWNTIDSCVGDAERCQQNDQKHRRTCSSVKFFPSSTAVKTMSHQGLLKL